MNKGAFIRLSRAVILALLLLGFWLLLSPRADAAINREINFQGKLTNPDGTNVTDGSYSIQFDIYTVASGGSSIWTETQGSVSVNDGIFRVSLGSVTSLPGSVDFNNSSLYLGITVGADPEMTPRVRFTAAPYAFNSDELDGIDSSGFVQIGPASAQTDASTNSLIFLNKTAAGNLLQLQQSAIDEFVVDNTGIVTTASINSGSIVDGTVANGDLVNDSVTVISGSGLITGGSVALGASVTVDVGAGDGVVVNANDIGLDVVTTGTTATLNSNSGLEVTSDGLRLLGGCGNGDVLSWNSSSSVWQCASNNAIYTGSKASDQAIGNTTTLTNITDMSFPIAANEEWYFEFVIQLNGDSQDDMNVAITCPAGATASYGVEAVEQTNSQGDIDCGTRSGNIGLPNGDEIAVVSGTVQNSTTAGTIQLQMSENASVDAGNDLTIFAGSSVHAMRIPIGTLVGTGGASFTSFDITDTTNTETIDDGNTVTFAAGAGLTVLVSATDTVTYTNILGATIETGEITDSNVTNAKLANDSVTVVAGSGLTTGGAVALGGSVTLDIGAGDGIVVNANDIGLDVVTTGTTATINSNSGLEVSSDGLRLLGGCSNGDVLSWNSSSSVWQCASNNAIYTGSTSSNQIIGNTTTLTNVTDMNFPIAASEEWYFEFVIQFNADATDDLNFAITCPAGATASYGIEAAENSSSQGNLDCGTRSGNIVVPNGDEVAVVSGTVQNSTTAGTVQLQMSENTTADAANNITVYSGSSVHAMRIPIGTLVGTGGSSFTSFDVTDTTNTETIDDGNTITFAAGAGLTVLVGATDTVTYTSVLGATVETGEITDGTILLADIAGNGCSTDDVMEYNGSAWICASNDDTVGNEITDVAVSGGLVRTGAGTTASPYNVGLRTDCAADEILRYESSVWVCSAPVYEKIAIWAEENAAASSTTSAGNQWSYGNGAVGAIGITLAEDWEIYAVSFDAETFGTSVSIDVMNRNGGGVLHSFTANSDNYSATLGSPVAVSAGDTIGFDTTATVGTSTDVRATVWLRRLP